MRSNSGHGKSNNNLRDPTMKDHEKAHDKGRTESTATMTSPNRAECVAAIADGNEPQRLSSQDS